MTWRRSSGDVPMITTGPARPVLFEERVLSRRVDLLLSQKDRLRKAIDALGPGAAESPFLAPVLAHCLVQVCTLRHLRAHVEGEWGP